MLLPFKQEEKGVQNVSSYIDNYEGKVYLTHTVKVATVARLVLAI